MALFKHLIHNKKPCYFVRTQCDSQINGILDQFEDTNPGMTAEAAFQRLKEDFRVYIQKEVLSQLDHKVKLGSFFFELNHCLTIHMLFPHTVSLRFQLNHQKLHNSIQVEK